VGGHPKEQPVKLFRALSALTLLAMLAVMPATAQEAPAPPKPIPAAPGVPNLTRYGNIPLNLPNNSVANATLKVNNQDEQGSFDGELFQRGAPSKRVAGLVEPTEAGGFLLEFVAEDEGTAQKVFVGSIFVGASVPGTPQRAHVSGIYTVMDGEKTLAGPFPFNGSADMAPDRRQLVEERRKLAEERRRKAAEEAGVVEPRPLARPAQPVPGGSIPTLQRRLRSLRGLVPNGNAVPIAPVAPAAPNVELQAAPASNPARLRLERFAITPKNVMEALERRKNLTIFTALVKQAGLEDSFRKVKMTVFAPEDAAFNKLPAGVLDGIRRDQASARKYLQYCVAYQHKYVTKGPEGAEELPASVIDASAGRLGVSRVNGRLWLMGNDSKRVPVLEESVDAGLGALYVTGGVLILKSVRFD
jgi:hypothetical protein